MIEASFIIIIIIIFWRFEVCILCSLNIYISKIFVLIYMLGIVLYEYMNT